MASEIKVGDIVYYNSTYDGCAKYAVVAEVDSYGRVWGTYSRNLEEAIAIGPVKDTYLTEDHVILYSKSKPKTKGIVKFLEETEVP